MIKVGFIGFGSFAKHRLKLLSQISYVHTIGFYDPYINENFDNLECFSDPEILLYNVDAVIIAVPPFVAPEYSYLALSNNVHVFCEKPPATNVEDLNKLKNFSDKLVLAYGFNHRLHDSIIKIKSIVDNKQMGEILWMRGRYGKEVNKDYINNWRCDYAKNGGGILIDQGLHLLDIMNWLAGGFDNNQTVLSNNYLQIANVEDNAFINLYSSSSSISASLHSTITQWRYLFSLEIFLENGSLILNGLRTRSGSYGDETLSIRPNIPLDHLDLREEEISYLLNDSWSLEMKTFVDSVLNNEPYPYCKLPDAINIMELLNNIYKNAKWTGVR